MPLLPSRAFEFGRPAFMGSWSYITGVSSSHDQLLMPSYIEKHEGQDLLQCKNICRLLRALAVVAHIGPRSKFFLFPRNIIRENCQGFYETGTFVPHRGLLQECSKPHIFHSRYEKEESQTWDVVWCTILQGTNGVMRKKKTLLSLFTIPS